MSLSFSRKKNLVGLDIGHHSIKVVELERTAAGWRVLHAESEPTPADAIRDGVVVNAEDVSDAIRHLLRKAKVSPTSVNIAVAGAAVVVRMVRIPKMPEATLRKSIKYEASRYVPSSVDDSYIEFEIVGTGDDGQMDVLIVAAPREIVSSRVTACEGAGLDVEVVDIEAFAAYRTVVESDPAGSWRNRSIALVDIGASSTNVSVVSSGVFTMTRTIPQGGNTLTEALQSYFNLDREDAEVGKAQLDLRDLIDDSKPVENPPLRVIQPQVDDLVREIRRSLNYYQSQQGESKESKPVEVILLSGGGSKLPGLAEYIGHKLGLDVVSTGVLQYPTIASPGLHIADGGLELSVASGLAMRDVAAA